MKLIKDAEFGGERPLFASHDLHIDHVVIREGESAIKECSNIMATNCRLRVITLLACAWICYKRLLFCCRRAVGFVVL